MKTYKLSTRQKKELLLRRKLVTVYLPVDTDDDPQSWKQWARDRIDMEPGTRVVWAQPMSVWTRRSNGQYRARTLESLLGEIIDNARDRHDDFCVAVEAVQVILAPSTVATNGNFHSGWPAFCRINGTMFPDNSNPKKKGHE